MIYSLARSAAPREIDPLNTLCKNCRGTYMTCNSCYNTFLFSESEKNFYDKKGLNYPKRCQNCRNKGKNNTSSNNGGIFSWFGF